jgi:hypothetical protein
MGVIDFDGLCIDHRRGDVFQSHMTFFNLERLVVRLWLSNYIFTY